MKTRVLVLGSAGFVGRHIVQHLEQSAWAEPILSQHRKTNPSKAEKLASVTLDATNFDQLSRAADGINFVINCVAGSKSTIIDNAKALAKLARSQDRLRIVHLSSMAVYGGGATGTITEKAPLKPGEDDYSKAKVFADHLMQDCGAIVLRPGIIYGLGSRIWTDRLTSLLRSRRLGDLGALGDGYCNLAYVKDVAFAAERALLISEDNLGCALNLCAPDQPTWNEYFIQCARAMRYTPVKRISPKQLWAETRLFAVPLKVLDILMERSSCNLESFPKPIAQSQLNLFRQRIRLDSQRATDLLKVNWTPLATALREIHQDNLL